MAQNDSEEEALKNRIRELEKEVEDREKDLAFFRKELLNANHRLEALLESLHQDLKVAHSIQQALVPTEIPNIHGFEFSAKFVPSHYHGGDYYDIFEHEDPAHFGVVLASSSGHSMSALLLSVMLKLTGQMEARRGASPHKVLHSMAQELVPKIEGDETADIFYAMVDRRKFELHYCALGSIVGLLQNYSSGEIQALEISGPGLGKNFNETLKSKTVTLNPRDRLIFCTRGIEEAQNLDGENFGAERLYRAILEAPQRGVHEVRNNVLYRVSKFISGQEPKRDMTLVVAEIKDRVIKLAKG